MLPVRRPAAISFATVMTACIFSACASGSPYAYGAQATGQPEMVTLRVRNNYWQDVRVYLLRGSGSPVRVGNVSGLGSKTLRLRHPMNGLAQLLLRPIGTRASFVTEAVAVQPGERLELTVQSSLNQTVLIRR